MQKRNYMEFLLWDKDNYYYFYPGDNMPDHQQQNVSSNISWEYSHNMIGLFTIINIILLSYVKIIV